MALDLCFRLCTDGLQFATAQLAHKVCFEFIVLGPANIGLGSMLALSPGCSLCSFWLFLGHQFKTNYVFYHFDLTRFLDLNETSTHLTPRPPTCLTFES